MDCFSRRPGLEQQTVLSCRSQRHSRPLWTKSNSPPSFPLELVRLLWIFPSFSSDRNRSYVISERSTISTTNPNTLWSPSVEEKPDILCSTSSNRSFVGSFSRNKTERNVTLLDVPLIVLRILLVRVRRAHTTLVDLELGIAAVVDKASLTNAPGLWLCAGSWDTWFTVISLLTIPDPSSGLVLDDL